jgi:hypothetical protein
MMIGGEAIGGAEACLLFVGVSAFDAGPDCALSKVLLTQRQVMNDPSATTTTRARTIPAMSLPCRIEPSSSLLQVNRKAAHSMPSYLLNTELEREMAHLQKMNEPGVQGWLSVESGDCSHNPRSRNERKDRQLIRTAQDIESGKSLTIK